MSEVSWQKLPLSAVGSLYCGQSPSTKDVNQEGKGTRYITGPEQWDGHKIHENKWTTNPKRVVPPGCIFITVKGSGVGKIFPGIAGAIGRDIYAFEPSEQHSAKFIEYALKFTVQDILLNAVGDIPGISKRHILDHEVTIPPLDQQKRIVAEIEKQFSRLDEAVGNLKRVKANLKRYKAAVLKSAVEGRLVETEAELAGREGRSYESGEKLLQRILKVRRQKWERTELAKMKEKGKTPKDDKWKQKYKEPAAPATTDLPELPAGWVWASVDQLLASLRNGLSRKPEDSAPGIPILRISAVRRLELDPTDTRYYRPQEDERVDNYTLEADDLLFVRYNGTKELVGACALASNAVGTLLYPDKLIRGRVVGQKEVSPPYLAIAANVGKSRQHIDELIKTTAGQQGIAGGQIKQMPIPLPPRTEQGRIVRKVDRRLSLLRETEAQVQANLRRAERLRQSILSRAFSGGLVNGNARDLATVALSASGA